MKSMSFLGQILNEMAQADLFGVPIPEEYGGFGGGCFDIVLAVEQLGRGCIGVGTAFAASSLGIYPIIFAGSEEMKKKYLPDVASGKKFAAFGLTEANAGSDASGIQTTAVLDGDEWVLNGTKQWITNGGEARDLYGGRHHRSQQGPARRPALSWKKAIRVLPAVRKRRKWGSGPRRPPN